MWNFATAKTEENSSQTVVRKALVAVLAALLGCVCLTACASGSTVTNPNVYPSKATTSSDGAAAQFNSSLYIPEQEVSDYIATYRSQMNLENDETWASFLSTYGYTPTSFRLITIRQLVMDELILLKAKELDITVSDDEIQQIIDNMKTYYAFQDDDIWQQTLESYGTTEEKVRQTYYLQLLYQKVEQNQVEYPTPTEDDVVSYVQTYSSALSESERVAKHTYCFKISANPEGSLENSTTISEVYDALSQPGALSEESFATAVTMYSDDEDLKAKTGANGWSLDSSSYSQTYLNYLEGLEEGQMSEIFTEEDGSFCIIYVDQTYTFPSSSASISSATLNAMPDSLRQYMEDSCAYAQWADLCDAYPASLLKEASLKVYSMPDDVPYNVELTSTDASTESDTGSAE